MVDGVSNTRRLRALIAAARDAQRLSYEQIAKRSGGRISPSNAHKLATLTWRSRPIEDETIIGLALGLGYDVKVVRDAVLADFGLSAEDRPAEVETLTVPRELGPGVRLLAQVYGALTPAERAHLERVAGTYLDRPGREQPECSP